MALNDKQERFCQEYIIDLNATQAATRAGYSDKTAYSQGQRLLKNVEVASRVKELQSGRAEKLNLDAEWVLQRLVQINDMCLVSVPVEKWDHKEKKMVQTGEYVFDSQGANRSAELIGKHLGMFKDKVEHSGTLGVQIVDDIR